MIWIYHYTIVNMKKALIGISNKIKEHKSKIKVWSESFRKFSNDDIILLSANPDEEDLRICDELNLKYHVVDVGDPWYINNKRLYHTAEYLKYSDVDVFLVTDVFDVLFQSNPFDKFDLETYDVFVSGEGIYLREEPWNTAVINKCFPGEIQHCINNEIICSGVIGGKRVPLIKLFERMHDMCENALNNHNVRDQAALILMIAKNEVENLKIFNLNDGWAMHCATSGPTQFFEGWGFKRNLEGRYSIPKLENNKICTDDGRTIDIVHQFNRVPEWHKIITSDYE